MRFFYQLKSDVSIGVSCLGSRYRFAVHEFPFVSVKRPLSLCEVIKRAVFWLVCWLFGFFFALYGLDEFDRKAEDDGDNSGKCHTAKCDSAEGNAGIADTDAEYDRG